MDWDWIYHSEPHLLDDAARSSTTGSFVRLDEGFTHYQVAGPDAREPVVLVHGFSVPCFIWDPTFDALTAAGYRVLRYDLFGRGFSDRPHVRYDLGLFVRQLGELLDALNVDRVSLIGLSMGGAIAAGFTVQNPTRVRRLVLIDPIGTEPMPFNLFYKAALLPGIGELGLSLTGLERMVESFAGDFFDPAEVERYRDRYRVQMQYRGFRRAILSTLRNKTLNGFPEVYEQLGGLATPVRLIWGRDDRTLPISQSKSLLHCMPRAEFHIIEEAGHIPHCEQPESVHPLLLEFLSHE